MAAATSHAHISLPELVTQNLASATPPAIAINGDFSSSIVRGWEMCIRDSPTRAFGLRKNLGGRPDFLLASRNPTAIGRRRAFRRLRDNAVATRSSGLPHAGNRLREHLDALDIAPGAPGDRRNTRGQVVGIDRFGIPQAQLPHDRVQGLSLIHI